MRNIHKCKKSDLTRFVEHAGLVGVHPKLRRLAERHACRDKTYFIQCGDRIKIGKAIDMERRLARLQTGMPHPPTVLAVVPAAVISERDAHREWAALRRHGEWFEATPELREWIKDMEARAKVLEGLYPRILRRLKEHYNTRPSPASTPLIGLADAERRLRRTDSRAEVA